MGIDGREPAVPERLQAARVGADPQAPLPVFVERRQAGRIQSIHGGVVRERSILEPAQSTRPRADPDRATAVLDDRVDVASHESLRHRIGGDDLLPHAVQAVAVGAQPEIAIAILEDRGEGHRLPARRRAERQRAMQNRIEVDRPRLSGWQDPRRVQCRVVDRAVGRRPNGPPGRKGARRVCPDVHDAAVGGRGPKRAVL